MSRDPRVYLEDILEATKKIQEYTKGFSLPKFSRDQKTLDAVVRNLEVIGEAVKKVPPSVRFRHPEIDWKRIAGLRDILVHEYFGIDVEIIWDIVKHKVPTLKVQISRILKV